MAIRPLSRSEVRSIDRRAAEELGLPTLVLMENAGRGAAELAARMAGGPPARVAVACGPGNNGGDGGVVARHLDAWGYEVRLAWLADPAGLGPDAKTQHAILARSGIAQHAWPDPAEADLAGLWAWADLVVDGLLGTGLSRPVEGAMLRAIDTINASGRPVLALDLPSGLDAETGRPLGRAIRARATATFVAPKIGFEAPGASDYTGEVTVFDIGVPSILLAPFRA